MVVVESILSFGGMSPLHCGVSGALCAPVNRRIDLLDLFYKERTGNRLDRKFAELDRDYRKDGYRTGDDSGLAVARQEHSTMCTHSGMH